MRTQFKFCREIGLLVGFPLIASLALASILTRGQRILGFDGFHYLEYAKRFRVGPGWLFLTGQEADVLLLRKKLGLYIDEIQAEDSGDHNLSLIIGNQKTGRWMKRSPFENPHVLADQLGNWLTGWKAPPK